MMAQSPPRIRPAILSIMANLLISFLRQDLLQREYIVIGVMASITAHLRRVS
jgi:hypothetical protein